MNGQGKDAEQVEGTQAGRGWGGARSGAGRRPAAGVARSALLNVRLTPADAGRVGELAAAAGLTPAAWVRGLVEGELARFAPAPVEKAPKRPRKEPNQTKF